MTCASIASGFTSLTTLVIFYLMVCPMQPLIIFSTAVAAFFSGALAALEGNGSKEQTTPSRPGKDSSPNPNASGNATSFGCVIGLVTSLISGYFAKSLEEPWRK
eukprot:CAMPEP_0201526058 /NCGR_PEP_ID=MMETSP0161_2-20130828/30499_1 /ASSEMBLY_ACC=CAM_ASM_000251 /TAXON_ID=180227 /ORGANISM="Neoparamoeba aestuarina, Strain SoJaBio B1-5/56/2" /LENGTH=103 /DNA_ID=CAMNT_0047926269 /DNA_START=143 /DNA_END=454 /DNA_ORIENTATION=+